MPTAHVKIIWVIGVLTLLSTAAYQARAGEPEAPPARKIPGISAPDPFPHSCVSCHIVLPDNRDTRISTLMKQLSVKVEPALLEKSQAAAPDGVTLKGKHPALGGAIGAVPGSCLKCHGMESKYAPPLSRMLHIIHLTGAEQNHYMTLFQGECTYCHKLDVKTGVSSIPNAQEQ